MTIAQLSSRKILRVSGPDATPLLQGLISNDIEKVKSGGVIYAALLSAQGKVQFDFLVIGAGDHIYWLDVEAARAEELIKKLKLYRLRAKAEIAAEDVAVFAVFGGSASPQKPEPGVICVPDPRLDALGMRLYGTQEAMVAPDSSVEEAYTAYRLSLGVPEGSEELGVEKLFLLEANLEELHGVDFKKGCYVGQELTARMKHKTDLKKRLLPFRAPMVPPPGSSLTTGGRELGQMIGWKAGVAFALVRLDRLPVNGNAPLQLGDQLVSLRRPAYLEGALSAA